MIQKYVMTALFDRYRLCKYVIGDSDVRVKDERRAFVERVEQAVDSLPQPERDLIQRRYQSSESKYLKDHVVYKELNIKPGKYGYYRNKAFVKLAIVLELVDSDQTN